MNIFAFLNLFFALVGVGFSFMGLGLGFAGDESAGLAMLMVGFASIATSLLFHKE